MFIKISGMCIDCISSFYIMREKYQRLGNFWRKETSSGSQFWRSRTKESHLITALLQAEVQDTVRYEGEGMWNR